MVVLQWIANKMYKIKNLIPKIVYPNNIKKFESKYLSLNSKKSLKKLQWKNIYSLDQTLLSIIQWHDAFEDKQNMNKFSKLQIENFSNNI